MPVYIGIDEAGYGPMFGPMTVGCAAMRVQKIEDLWQTIGPAVARGLQEAKKTGGLAVADSKQLTGRKDGLKPLELGCLAFAAQEKQPHPGEPIPIDTTSAWLDHLGAPAANEDLLPWYDEGDWQPLPADASEGEVGIASTVLGKALNSAGIECLGLRCAVVYEDNFNRMVQAMHNKALVNFHHVQQHLFRAWKAFGKEHAFVAVDRQGGRKDYRESLKWTFPDASLTEGQISDTHSGYRVEQGDRKMTIVFETRSEEKHLPVALASMTAKWTRELMMRRFNAWWSVRLPDVKPTKGYGTDGNRWWREVNPHLRKLNINPRNLRRAAPGR